MRACPIISTRTRIRGWLIGGCSCITGGVNKAAASAIAGAMVIAAGLVDRMLVLDTITRLPTNEAKECFSALLLLVWYYETQLHEEDPLLTDHFKAGSTSNQPVHLGPTDGSVERYVGALKKALTQSEEAQLAELTQQHQAEEEHTGAFPYNP